jgi:hypothetical protein
LTRFAQGFNKPARSVYTVDFFVPFILSFLGFVASPRRPPRPFSVCCFPTDSPMLQIRIIYANCLFKRIDDTAKLVWTTSHVLGVCSTQNDIRLIDATERHSGRRLDSQVGPFVVAHFKVKRRGAVQVYFSA